MDLLFRLAQVRLRLRPLDERHDDIIPIAEALLRRMDGPKLSGEARKLLVTMSWPGNVRELKWTLENAVALQDTESTGLRELSVSSLKDALDIGSREEASILSKLDCPPRRLPLDQAIDVPKYLVAIEILLIERALDMSPSQTAASKLLGYNTLQALQARLRSLAKKAAEFHLDRPAWLADSAGDQ